MCVYIYIYIYVFNYLSTLNPVESNHRDGPAAHKHFKSTCTCTCVY